MFYERNSRNFFLHAERTLDIAKANRGIDTPPTAEEYSKVSNSDAVEFPKNQSAELQATGPPVIVASQTGIAPARSKDNDYLSTSPGESSASFPNSNHTKKQVLNRPLRVLVADDNLLIRTSLLNLFEKWGFDYSICENGESAWNALQQECFDLVLIDLQMPLMDGHEVVACVRANEQFPNQQVPIVAMAGSSDELAKEQMFAAGASSYVNKPLDPHYLFQIITEHTLLPEYQQVSLYTDVLDQEALKELYQDDTAHLEMMLDIFLRNTPPALENMEVAVEQQDWNELERMVHKMRPTFAMVGLQKVSEIAGNFETKLNQQKRLIYNNIYTDFHRFYEAAKQALQVISEQRESIRDSIKQ